MKVLTFSLSAMYESPRLFTHYVAISPAAVWANEQLATIDTQYSKSNSSLDASLYITYGTDEYTPYVQALERYIAQIQSRDYKGLDVSLGTVKGMRHATMTSEGFVRGIAWAFSDIRPEGPSTFERMNIEASRKRELE